MKYELLYQEAKRIDRLIDLNMHVRQSQFISQENLKILIIAAFPDFCVEASGWHKIVLINRKIDGHVVLKVGSKTSIENDHQTYKNVPKRLRHQLFAKIFWHTKYCLLQEYGESVYVTVAELNCLRRTVYQYGIFDVKEENLRVIRGELKIVDANMTRVRLPYVLRRLDEIKRNLPDRLELLIKKISRRLNKQ